MRADYTIIMERASLVGKLKDEVTMETATTVEAAPTTSCLVYCLEVVVASFHTQCHQDDDDEGVQELPMSILALAISFISISVFISFESVSSSFYFFYVRSSSFFFSVIVRYRVLRFHLDGRCGMVRRKKSGVVKEKINGEAGNKKKSTKNAEYKRKLNLKLIRNTVDSVNGTQATGKKAEKNFSPVLFAVFVVFLWFSSYRRTTERMEKKSSAHTMEKDERTPNRGNKSPKMRQSDGCVCWCEPGRKRKKND